MLQGFAAEYNDELLLADTDLLHSVLLWSTREPIVSSLSMTAIPEGLLNDSNRLWFPAVLHRAYMLRERHWSEVALVRAAVTVCQRLVHNGNVDSNDSALVEATIVARLPREILRFLSSIHSSTSADGTCG